MKYLIPILILIILIPGSAHNSCAQGNTISFEHFSQENGLSNNIVQCCYQDLRGYLWFGTSQGLNRFDGYKFTQFLYTPEDSTSLYGNLVRVIFETREGQLLIGTENGGLNLFNRDKEVFSNVLARFQDPRLHTRSVNDVEEDQSGRLWVATDDGLLLLPHNLSSREVVRFGTEAVSGSAQAFIRVIVFDTSGHLWMGTNAGVYVMDTLKKEAVKFDLPVGDPDHNEIWELTLDADGRIWVGTYDYGIFTINKSHRIEDHILPDPENRRSLTVRSISPDRKGNLWLGTRGGIYIYQHGTGLISTYAHDEREAHSLSGNSVLDIFHDARGDTWIGTRTGINYLVHSKQAFSNFSAMPGDNRFLNNNEIWAFWSDASGKLWIGTEEGGVNIYDPGSRQFRYLVSQPGVKNSLTSNCIKHFMDDGKGNLWIATYRGGINRLNLKSGSLSAFRNDPNNPKSLSDDRVWSLCRDHQNRIWVATTRGLDLYDSENSEFHPISVFPSNYMLNWIREDNKGILWIGGKDTLYQYSHPSGILRKFPEYSRDFLQDRKGRIWIATLTKGLALYDPEKGAIRYFGEKEGLAHNRTVSILEDSAGHLWIGTTKGLSWFDPESLTFRNYTEKDGLQNSQLNYGAAYRLPTGEFAMGGISGFNIFDPLNVRTNDYVPPVVFTGLSIVNRKVEVGNDRRSILSKSISETKEITLPFSKNALTIEFAALDYFNSANNLYTYMLDNFDEEWSYPSINRAATYTNLDPGTYTFRVKSFIPGIKETNNDILLKIKILPPFWKTILFKLALLLLIAGLFYLLVRFLVAREKMKNDLLFERVKARKLHELDMLKLSFFTNISHEIRTPLSLILGPVEKLKNNVLPAEQQKPLLDIIHRNARHLNQLFNQILDMRKLEAGNLKIELVDGELVSFIREIKDQFNHLAKEKEIDYVFNSLARKVDCRFDPEKLEKIINNLLSNAFKFTPKGGKISLNLALVFDPAPELLDGDIEKGIIEISVKDSGRGIATEHLDQIFNRFFQSGERSEMPGTGIGLTLVKDLVKLMNGQIFVNSKPGQGSRFTVRLPLIEPCNELPDPEAKSEGGEDPENIPVVVPASFQEKILLIVEDNPDVRFFIRHHFESFYKVMEAADGQQGWESAVENIPDIILCDVLMPVMNGFDLLKRLKNDENTSHIPVIMLTALGSKEHEMEGLSAGADDYISKPFDLNILQTKMENLLAVRQSLKEKYSGEIVLQPRNVLISSPDERFMRRVIETVEANMADPDLDIEKFAVEVGVSRMQLYRKLHFLTDMTVKEFIRDIRLKRAAQLLHQNKQNVSEIAYAVGFRDLSHFRKCFRQKFGMSASEYLEAKK